MTMWENQVEKEHHGKPVPEVFISGEGALPEAPLTPPAIAGVRQAGDDPELRQADGQDPGRRHGLIKPKAL